MAVIPVDVYYVARKRLCNWLNSSSFADDGNDIRCIVFVKERYNAFALNIFLDILSAAPDSTYTSLRTGYCVGQLEQSGSEESTGDNIGLSNKQFASTIKKFREGKLNLLISTDVVEEGFDVPECRMIIRFDPPTNYRSYVQSKGRARAQNSKFIVMIDAKLVTQTKTDLEQFQATEKLMLGHCVGRIGPTEEDRDDHFDDDSSHPPFQPPGSQAKISINTALVSLQRYCNQLPNDNMISASITPTYKKISSGWYECKVYLPRSAAIKDPVVGMEKTKRVAKKVAALQCCKLLYEKGELDHVHLLPKSAIDRAADETEFLGQHEREQVPKGHPVPGTRQRVQVYPKKVPSKLERTASKTGVLLYLYGISLTVKGIIGAGDMKLLDMPEEIMIGFIISRPLPSLPEFPIFNALKQYAVKCPLLATMQLDSTELTELQTFHKTVFEHVLSFNKIPEKYQFSPGADSLNMIIAPVIQSSSTWTVDWNIVRHLTVRDGFHVTALNLSMEEEEEYRRNRILKPELFEDSVVVTSYKGEPERYFVMGIRSDLTPATAIHENGESSSEYMRHKYGVNIQQENQPMLLLQHCSKGLNFLRPKPLGMRTALEARQHIKGSRLILMAAELCQILPITGQLYQIFRIVPSVIHRITWLCHMLDFYHYLRQETGIGSKQPFPQEWRPLAYTEPKFSNVYSCPVESPSASSDSDSYMSTDQEALMAADPGESVPEPPLADRRDEPGPFRLGFMRQHHYKKVELNRRRRVQDQLNLGLASRLTIVPVRSVTRVLSKGKLGCAESLAEPPFSLDNDFLLNADEGKFPEITSLLEAVTTAYAGDCFNMERLETMGDSFLKLSSCIYLYSTYPQYHEGVLTILKSKQVSNYNLYRLAKARNIPSYINNQCCEPALNFLPPGFVLDQNESCSDRTHQKLRDKSIADVMEALIGAVLVECGPPSAQKLMEWMGLKVTSSGIRIGVCRPDIVASPLLRDENEAGVRHDLTELTAGFDAFENAIGYRFRQPAFLLQAFSHSSFFKNRITDCYQRLEFLGDAILDFLVTRCLYEQKEYLTPGQLTDLRSALVNNKTFSTLAVKYGFHQHLRYNSIKIFGLIKKYVDQQSREDPAIHPLPDDMFFYEDDEDDDDDTGSIEGLEMAEDPKTLGDIFESVAGAIFLDSGYSLDAVWKVYYNMMKERIEYCVQHCPKNPVRTLFELKILECTFSKPEKVRNKVRVAVEIVGEDGNKTFYGVGNNRRAAKSSAARAALKELSPDAKLF